MASPWSPAQHGVDVNGYVPQHGAHYDAPHSPASYNSNQQAYFRQQQQQAPGGSAPSSPGRRALAWFKKPSSKSRSREREDRSASPNADAGARTPSPTFVVRNVIKQPGGVSLDANYAAGGTSPSRRMTLDDDDAGGQLNYSRSRSKPIGAPSLGVPPGGRGGGTGYGVAGSSNDGRPIHPDDAYGAEQEQGSWSRGRSPSTGTPRRPASPGAAMTAGAFRTQSNSRVSPGPQSSSQMQQQQQQQQQYAGSPAAGKQAPRGPRNAPGMGSSPTAAALSSSPLAPQLSGAQAHAHAYGQAPEQQRQTTYAVSRSIDMRNGPPPIIPLDGMPSPISIPRRIDSPHSPLGTPSPGRSPDGRAQANGSPSLGAGAGKWMSKLFSRSPRADSPAAEETYGWGRGTSPNPGATPYGLATPNWAGTGGSGATPDDEREAALQKRASQREAARIVDAEREAVLARPTQRSDAATPWTPRQAVPNAQDMSLERQTRSPPGRKPVPRFDDGLNAPNPDLTAEQLRRMSIGTREDVAKQVDPHDALSRLEGRLTPAQQIIAETRSKHLAREKLQSDAARRNSDAAQVTRGFDTSAPATPHEREVSKGPTLPSKSPAPSRIKASDPPTEDDTLVAASPADEEVPVRRGSRRVPAPGSPTKAAAAQAPGSAAATPSRGAALPKAGGGSALQPGNGPMPIDMPLPAALQEMMVRFYRFERYAVPLIRSLESRLLDIERDAQLAINGDAASANSARDREMDRWVGQMTGLMKHEVGQLKAATREIREGRELLASAVSGKSPMQTQSGFMQRDAATQDSLSSTRADTGAVSKQPLTPIVTERLDNGARQAQAQAARSPVSAVQAHAERATNISSASFNSAVPRGALGLPAGAKPALDKDEGKSAHGKAVQEAPGAARRERSTSPGGRPRFTSALGEPMQAGRISPGMPRREASENSLEPPPANRFAAGAANINRGASPAPSETGSNVSGRSRGGRSLDERLKSLVVENQLKSPVSASQLSIAEQDDDDEADDAASSKVGDDYPLRDAQVVREDETIVAAHYPVTAVRARANSHAQQPSGSSQATYTPKPSGASVHRSNTLAAPSAPPLLGGRTSPSPSSHSAHSPNARRSTSPANFIPPPPAVSASAITTSSNMSQGIRARAQSYLATADSVPPSPAAGAASTAAATPTSAARGTSPTPGSWLSGGRSEVSSPTRRSISPSKVDPASPPKLGRPLSTYSSAGALARSGSATQPLSIKKSAGALSAKSTPASPALGTGASARKGPPPGASLKDRVAFFDQASS